MSPNPKEALARAKVGGDWLGCPRFGVFHREGPSDFERETIISGAVAFVVPFVTWTV